MKIKTLISLCTLVACALCSCRNGIEEELLKEEQKLAEYIKTTYGDAAISLGGGAYLVKTHEEEESEVVEAGNYILWNWKVTNQITGALEYSSDLTNSQFVDSYFHGGPEITVVLSSKIDEGLVKMKKGERSNVYIPSRWLYHDFQPRIFNVDIVDVITDLTVYQETLMAEHIKSLQHKYYRDDSIPTIPNVESTVDGKKYNVMYHILDKGSGEEIADDMLETTTSISYMVREEVIHPYLVDMDLSWNTTESGQMNTHTKTNCVGEILKEINKKGGKVVVAMPSKLYWNDDDLPKNVQGQFFIPKWSVVFFTITVK